MTIVFKKRPAEFTDEVCAGIFRDAHRAGLHAAELVMTPYAARYLPNGARLLSPAPTHKGEAWVSVPLNTPFSRWMHKHELASGRASYGACMYVPRFDQDLDKKRQYAHAFANVLNLRGVTASSHALEEK